MNGIDEISLLFIWLTRIGIALRIVYCYLKKMGDDDEGAVYNKRIKNAIVFYIFAESIFQLKDIAIYYFKYGGG